MPVRQLVNTFSVTGSDAPEAKFLFIATCPVNISHVLRLSECSWKQPASDPSNPHICRADVETAITAQKNELWKGGVLFGGRVS